MTIFVLITALTLYVPGFTIVVVEATGTDASYWVRYLHKWSLFGYNGFLFLLSLSSALLILYLADTKYNQTFSNSIHSDIEMRNLQNFYDDYYDDAYDTHITGGYRSIQEINKAWSYIDD